jgi:hypothetical protein
VYADERLVLAADIKPVMLMMTNNCLKLSFAMPCHSPCK